ncbi:MAG: FHA domain-containing protein, partial [Polyangiaceae bacterium]
MSSHELPTAVVEAVHASGRRLVASVNGALVVIDLPERGNFVIGRGSDCDYVLDEASISRRHASLEIGDTVRIEDLGSANGTMVGGKRL